MWQWQITDPVVLQKWKGGEGQSAVPDGTFLFKNVSTLKIVEKMPKTSVEDGKVVQWVFVIFVAWKQLAIVLQ